MGWIDKGFSSRRRRLTTNKFHDRCFALKRLLLHVERGEQPRLKLRKDKVLRQCQQVSNGLASGAGKTPVEVAIRRQSQASASAAKGLALIGDDAEGALPRNVEPYGGRIKWRVSPLEFEGFSDQVQQALHREKILRETLALVEMTHPHQLDEAQFYVSLQAKLEERQHVVAIHRSHWRRVDLELNPSSLCGCYAFQHSRKVTAPRYLLELERVKGIQADI